MINILTDSTADLGPELTQRYQIRTIPLYVNLAEKTLRDGIEVDTQALFDSVKATGQLPKTSAPTLVDFVKAFKDAGECVYIGISSQLSATHQNACTAQAHLSDIPIQVIDSLNLSAGIGLLVIKAAEMRDRGYSAIGIAERIKTLVPKVRTSFVIETLDYLYKGGRCSALENVVGSLLKIRPIIQVRGDGTMGVKAKTRGKRLKALDAMLEDFRNQVSEVDLDRVFVTHTGCDEDAEYLKTELLKIAPIKEVHITRAGSVIASHCGPDTIGILFLVK